METSLQEKEINHQEAPATTLVQNKEKDYTIPLVFWFNRNPQQLLPLCILPYRQVNVDLMFSEPPKQNDTV